MGGRGSGRRSSTPFDPAEGCEFWERQPGESAKAWAAFVAYRDLGPMRTVAKLAKKLGKRPIYRRTCEQWSVRWGWRVRVDAWDDHADRVARAATLEEAEKRARERLRGAELMVDVSIKSLYLWNKKLNHIVAQAQQAPPDAEPPTSPISPSDTAKLADAGVKLVQLLEGRPTEINENRERLTIEERRKGIQRLIRNPRLRAAMRSVALAMEEQMGEAEAAPDPGGNGHDRSVH